MSYIENDRKVIFLYYIENICIGWIMISTKWNGYAYIDDIAVSKDYRRNGIGVALLNKAIEWAKENGLC